MYRAISLLLMIAASCATAASDSAELRLPERGICAHRGASQTHPENTLAAFREAIRLGAHMIEFDVALTKDGELALMHDLTVDRTTDGRGKVADLTMAEIKKLDAGRWKSPEFAGERVPTLREALAVMPVNCWLNVHLKGGKEVGEKSARAVAAEGRFHQAFLACDGAAADAARRVEPKILICNMERQGDNDAYVKDTIARHVQFIQLAFVRGADLEKSVAELKQHGIHINYFGTDSPDELRALFKAGVEFPLVNNVGPLIAVAKELGIEPVTPIMK